MGVTTTYEETEVTEPAFGVVNDYTPEGIVYRCVKSGFKTAPHATHAEAEAEMAAYIRQAPPPGGGLSVEEQEEAGEAEAEATRAAVEAGAEVFVDEGNDGKQEAEGEGTEDPAGAEADEATENEEEEVA